MQVNVPADFPYPSFFWVASRAAGLTAPQVEPVGILLVKQVLLADDTLLPKDDQLIFRKDVLYEAVPPDAIEADQRLEIQFESDLVSYKPLLDVVAVRQSSLRGSFGSIRIDRQDGAGFQPNPGLWLNYGWLSRVQPTERFIPPLPAAPADVANPRKGLEGDAASFTPDPDDKYKLPSGFNNQFFNGGRIRPLAPLQAGQIVEFINPTHRVTILDAPTLNFKLNGKSITADIALEQQADTVVFDAVQDRFLISWRSVFPWSDRFNDPTATLEVS